MHMTYRAVQLLAGDDRFLPLYRKVGTSTHCGPAAPAGSSGVLTLRPQNNGDDSSGWHVNSVRMEPYVVHPSALVRVGTPIRFPKQIVAVSLPHRITVMPA